MIKTAARAFFLGFVAVLGGCSSSSVPPAPQAAADPAILKELSISTPWGLPSNGIRARIALDRDSAVETSSIRSAFVLENTTDNALAISAPAAAPIAWMAGDMRLPVDTHLSAPSEKTVSIQLPPHASRAFGPWDVPIPPGHDHLFLSARLGAVQSPPIEVRVAPAEWGPTVDGLRIRLSSPHTTYPVGEGAALQLFIHNTTNAPISIYEPNWESLDDDTKGDLTVLLAKTADDRFATIPAGGFIERTFPEPMLLAPGSYRVRFQLDSPELSIEHAPAWHGKLASNTLDLEVK